MATAVLSVWTLSCGDASVELGGEEADKLGDGQQKEQWSAADNPALFNSNLQFNLEALPTQGQAQTIPWAGNYWPVYEDSINFRWDGESSMSAAEKYGKAFNVANVEDQVSKFHGIDSAMAQKSCSADAECNSALGETCAKRRGATAGRCIATWWGICHAWSPAAILLPEPLHPVTRNGVTFKIQDLKALASLVHNATTSKFVSLRCGKGTAGNEVTYDAYGRPADSDVSCRDTNPGTFHLLLANYLGVMKQSFVEDRVFDFEVWNQPLRGYKVLQKRTVSATEANTLLGVTSAGGTTTTQSGILAKDAWTHYPPVAVSAGSKVKVQMTGTGDADLYVKFGAQPSAEGYDCRPYGDDANETCELTVPTGATQLFVSVNGYADSSTFTVATTIGGTTPTAYVFDANATSFVYVQTQVQYISEASASTDGNLASTIDSYTGTDTYEYILELDANGKVIGGEWVGESKKDHPDFVWLPTGVAQPSVAGGAISYAQVKSLMDESVLDPNATPPPAAQQTVTQGGTVAQNELRVFGPFKVSSGTLNAVMTGTGDADLYVKKGSAPTLASYDCRPYLNGSAESCAVAGPGDVYVAVNGYAASSTFSLVITYTEGGAVVLPPPPPTTTSTQLNVAGSVALHEMKVFTLPVAAGRKLRITTTAPHDVDVYVQLNAVPTTAAYLQRVHTASGNETMDLTLTSNGTLQVGIYGFAASTFTLKTVDL